MQSVFRLDLAVFRSIHVGLHCPTSDYLFALLSYSGLTQVQVGFLLLFLRSSETRRWVWPSITGVCLSGVLAQGLKRLVERDRPSNLSFAMPQENWLSNSFPSGHTTTSFALAIMLVLLARGTRYAKASWMALPWAALVGMSRVYRGVHWPSDAFAGMCVGTLVAVMVLRFWRWPTNREPD